MSLTPLQIRVNGENILLWSRINFTEGNQNGESVATASINCFLSPTLYTQATDPPRRHGHNQDHK